MASGATRFVKGVATGTGAALTIDKDKVGFPPVGVKIFNETGLAWAVWYDHMAAASALKWVTAGTMSKVTTGGITATTTGFTLGTDADLNVSGEVFHYEVWG